MSDAHESQKSHVLCSRIVIMAVSLHMGPGSKPRTSGRVVNTLYHLNSLFCSTMDSLLLGYQCWDAEKTVGNREHVILQEFPICSFFISIHFFHAYFHQTHHFPPNINKPIPCLEKIWL